MSKTVTPTERDAERFWQRVDRRGDDECWLWTGGTYGASGYGSFWMQGRSWGAHVAALLIERISIPAGHLVLHSCDVPLCCNFVGHLEVGTQSKNIRDAHKRGRIDRYAARSASAQLSEEQVRAIRAAYTGKRGEQAALARQYGVHWVTVFDIVHRKTWADIEP